MGGGIMIWFLLYCFGVLIVYENVEWIFNPPLPYDNVRAAILWPVIVVYFLWGLCTGNSKITKTKT